jgi:hypothetical protein
MNGAVVSADENGFRNGNSMDFTATLDEGTHVI